MEHGPIGIEQKSDSLSHIFCDQGSDAQKDQEKDQKKRESIFQRFDFAFFGFPLLSSSIAIEK